LLSDDMTWKNLCVKHDYGRRLSEVYTAVPMFQAPRPSPQPLVQTESEFASTSFPGAIPLASTHVSGSRSFDGSQLQSQNQTKIRSYKSHFKQRYLVEGNWRCGGTSVTKNITQEGGVVTSLHLTSKYIIVALDNAKIHVFDTEGNPQRTLQGHVMGVWAMVPWDDILVSGGCDRDVRVWDLSTG
jgi:F-box and WD-40 domain protein CDC4